MTESIALSKVQLEAAGYLASGMSQEVTGQRVGVARATVNRWAKSEAFKAEVDRRKQKELQAHQEASDRLQGVEVNEFYEELRKYRKTRLDLYRMKLAIGSKMLQKAGNRMRDLPEESIAPQAIPALVNAADTLTENAMSGMAELIGLDVLMERLNEIEVSSTEIS